MTRPRLLVVINNFPPDRGGGAAVIGDMCEGLAARGFDVTVRCAYPYYPEWTDKSGRNGWRIWRYTDQGLQVERYGLYIPRDPNSILQRLVHEASYLLSLLRSLGRGRGFDVVMAYCPAVSNVVFAAVNKLLWRKPLWLNVQDLAAEAAAASGLVRRAWLGRLLRAVQAWFFNRADVWSTISPVMAARLAPMRARSQPLHLVPNWLNESLRLEIDAAAAHGGPRRLHAPVRLLYAGNIGKKQNLIGLLRRLAASDLAFEFRVHGSGAQAGEIEAYLRQLGDARFSFGPFLDERGFAGVLQWTDFFVITETGDSGASFMPSKMIPGIYSGAPILAVCDADGPLGSEVRTHALGPWLPWSELDALLARLAATGEAEHAQWVANARTRTRAYLRDAIIDDIAERLRQLVSAPSAPAAPADEVSRRELR